VVERKRNGGDYGSYFIVLNTWKAFNVKDYQILFNVKELPDQLVSGTDVTGREHLCRKYGKAGVASTPAAQGESASAPGGGWLSVRPDADVMQLEAFRDMVTKFKQGEFFEALTLEFTGKLKEIALELIDFRRDLQRRLEPGIVDLAEKDIPEASNQLEAVNETLEQSTMKIMDINDEIMGLANARVRELESLMAGTDQAGTGQGSKRDMVLQVLMRSHLQSFRELGRLALSMMEPLSFQDLVGQRIQRIIKLVKSMEVKIEELIISFGIKMRRYKEDPNLSFEALRVEVEEFKGELKGPQREGEGLDQAAIDQLLGTL